MTMRGSSPPAGLFYFLVVTLWKKICCTCKWYALEESVCCNGESEHRVDFRFLDDSCECCEDIENDKTRSKENEKRII